MKFSLAFGWHFWQVLTLFAPAASIDFGSVSGRMLCEPWQSLQRATLA